MEDEGGGEDRMKGMDGSSKIVAVVFAAMMQTVVVSCSQPCHEKENDENLGEIIHQIQRDCIRWDDDAVDKCCVGSLLRADEYTKCTGKEDREGCLMTFTAGDWWGCVDTEDGKGWDGTITMKDESPGECAIEDVVHILPKDIDRENVNVTLKAGWGCPSLFDCAEYAHMEKKGEISSIHIERKTPTLTERAIRTPDGELVIEYGYSIPELLSGLAGAGYRVTNEKYYDAAEGGSEPSYKTGVEWRTGEWAHAVIEFEKEGRTGSASLGRVRGLDEIWMDTHVDGSSPLHEVEQYKEMTKKKGSAGHIEMKIEISDESGVDTVFLGTVDACEYIMRREPNR